MRMARINYSLKNAWEDATIEITDPPEEGVEITADWLQENQDCWYLSDIKNSGSDGCFDIEIDWIDI